MKGMMWVEYHAVDRHVFLIQTLEYQKDVTKNQQGYEFGNMMVKVLKGHAFKLREGFPWDWVARFNPKQMLLVYGYDCTETYNIFRLKTKCEEAWLLEGR